MGDCMDGGKSEQEVHADETLSDNVRGNSVQDDSVTTEDMLLSRTATNPVGPETSIPEASTSQKVIGCQETFLLRFDESHRINVQSAVEQDLGGQCVGQAATTEDSVTIQSTAKNSHADQNHNAVAETGTTTGPANQNELKCDVERSIENNTEEADKTTARDDDATVKQCAVSHAEPADGSEAHPDPSHVRVNSDVPKRPTNQDTRDRVKDCEKHSNKADADTPALEPRRKKKLDPAFDSTIDQNQTFHSSRSEPRTQQPQPIQAHGEVFSVPTLFHFASSLGVTRVLERLVENALSSNRPLDHVLLHGPPGSGTTLVARAIIRDLAPKNFVELDLLDGVDQNTLRRAIREVRHQGVLLIRHIELMTSADEQFLMSCIARKVVRGTGSFARDMPSGTDAPVKKKRPMDEFVTDTVRRPFPKIDGNFTLIGTAHLTQQIGYQLRNRFDHLIHLRSDSIGVRKSMQRTLARHGLHVDENAYGLIDQYVRTMNDVADQFVRALVLRAQLDETCCIDAQLVRLVITEDMPGRIADEVYAWSLVRHLGGRRVTTVTDNEVERIDAETGWGEIAVRAALGLVVRNQSTRAVPPAA